MSKKYILSIFLSITPIFAMETERTNVTTTNAIAWVVRKKENSTNLYKPQSMPQDAFNLLSNVRNTHIGTGIATFKNPLALYSISQATLRTTCSLTQYSANKYTDILSAYTLARTIVALDYLQPKNENLILELVAIFRKKLLINTQAFIPNTDEPKSTPRKVSKMLYSSLNATGTHILAEPDAHTIGFFNRCNIYNAHTLEKSMVLKKENHFIALIACSPNGKYIATAGLYHEDMCIWDAQTGKELCTETFDEGSSTQKLVWSPDSRFIAIRTSDNKLHIFSIRSKGVMHTFNITAWYDEPFVWSPDSTRLLILISCMRPVIIDFLDNKKDFSVDRMNCAAWSPDGKYIAGSYYSNIYLYDAKTGKKLVTINNSANPKDLVWHPNSKYLAASYERYVNKQQVNYIKIWNTKTQTALNHLLVNDYIKSMVWFDNGKKLASSGLGLTVWRPVIHINQKKLHYLVATYLKTEQLNHYLSLIKALQNKNRLKGLKIL